MVFSPSIFYALPELTERGNKRGKEQQKQNKMYNLPQSSHLSYVNTVIAKKLSFGRRVQEGGVFGLSKLPFSSVKGNVLINFLPATLLVFFIYVQILTDNYFTLVLG